MSDGILLIDKPSGWTSFDVVAKIRSASKIKSVGHAGTLDPMATGLLVILLGRATKSASRFSGGDKAYSGEITLGIETDSFDADGRVVATKSVDSSLDADTIRMLFASFVGEQLQVPPMYSAKKQAGTRLYDLARKGVVVPREPVRVRIFQLDLLELIPGQNPKLRFSCRCTKGTYIRSLAHDIGVKLGCGAHLSSLRRTGSDPFSIDRAISVDEAVRLINAREMDKILVQDEFIS